ncbi:hypothetical protein [Rhizobium laguerreae]|uniref:hypothetical protein n=1 Tax=Rhizobium laguerreae TaxID=1076926 RepID=UPI001C8FD792|nr:hypothetical protein [Rhizobium laguerreae]MBY3219465.1 hypothetical protein [Rhizobium laguerreae]MBY3348917.1 hypothetical protein [Rhizobium laguerreae]MBY3355960.1 hypothetical protein [Rhizobium laguerreae]MBY3370210.1 hypothetical protein [Rhizobium laguerreae]MBY3377071.1 hypothetical protein [Rhizobium laguerreae]
MASPWKLLARLVSPRRQQRQEHGSTDDVKPDVLAIAKPTETAAKNELNAADRSADEKPTLHSHSAAESVDPDHADKTTSSVNDTTDVESAALDKAADSAPFNEADIAAHAAPKSSEIDESSARKRGRQAKKAKVVDVDSQPSPRVSIVSVDAISLDGEIRLLRDQLARKLRLQNAQLKRMLERFER